jgi:ABC-type nitrate/sulfonate/bicarbonate transport system substrate-binding protein
METAVKNRSVDAFAAFEPGSFNLMKALKDDGFVVPLPTIYTMSFNLAGLNAVILQRREQMPKLLRALEKAVRFIDTDPRKAQAILVERLKVDASFGGWAWADYRFNLTLNQSLLTTLESQAQWAIRQTLVAGKTVPDYLDLIETKPLATVRPASVTVVK